MRFEERVLKPYSEPVSPDELQIDETYFAVLFLDTMATSLSLEPRVFIGRNLEPGDEEKLYFQDYVSYKRGIRIDTATKDDELFLKQVVKNTPSSMNALSTYSCCALLGAGNLLKRIEVRRPCLINNGNRKLARYQNKCRSNWSAYRLGEEERRTTPIIRWVMQLREVRRAERARAVPRLWWSLAVTSASCVRSLRR
jgi:hypothetical protein